jgi:hypothetical protein
MPHSNKDIYHYYYFDIFNVCLSIWNRCLDTFLSIFVYMKLLLILFWQWYILWNDILFNISVISWRSVLLVEETGGPGENHWPRAPDNVQVQRVIIPYFWKWWVFAYLKIRKTSKIFIIDDQNCSTFFLFFFIFETSSDCDTTVYCECKGNMQIPIIFKSRG